MDKYELYVQQGERYSGPLLILEMAKTLTDRILARSLVYYDRVASYVRKAASDGFRD
jgi:hypothetical protein